jgi:small-conductance mechanosensitive channel
LLLFLLQLEIFTPDFWQSALSPERILAYAASAIKILVVLCLAWIASALVNRLIPRVQEYLVSSMQRHRGSDGEMAKRAKTISTLFRRTISVIIWVIAIITALQQAGFDIAPILATAGVAGLAISFGAQNLVRDVISGVIILLENQIRVGDVAQLNGVGGLVEEINLRTVRLRALDGTVHIFPNGGITTLANMTNEYSYYLWDLGVGYKEDPDHVVEVVTELAREMRQEPVYSDAILDDLEVLGVDQLGENAVIIKMRIKTRPIQQWMVGREMNRRIKKRFDELGIELPFPRRQLYLGSGVAGELAGLTGGTEGASFDRELLKEVVREVIAEMQSEPVRNEASPKPTGESGPGAASPDARQHRKQGEHNIAPGG